MKRDATSIQVSETAAAEQTPALPNAPYRPAAGKHSRTARNVSDVITGEILRSEAARKWYPLAAWCILLIFLYIGHIFDFQRLQRIEMVRQLSLHEQRSRAMVIFSMKMNAVRHSNIVKEIERRGIPLYESGQPPAVAE